MTPVTPIIGDATCDSTVDVRDLLAVINAWHTTSSAADLNHDGRVNVQDLLLVINHWSAN